MSNPNPSPDAPPTSPLHDISDAELKRVFDQFDTNGDGKISADELQHVLSSLSASSAPTTAEDVRRAMEEVDADKDGFIDLAEFSALCRCPSSAASAESELRDAFNLYDRDGNGLISSKELHSVMNRLNMKCSVEDCERMIRSVDSDGDGFVNFVEFKKMMTMNPASNHGK
ncbi:hypothetical protein MLD38_024025 [Melastoma candidum]|uniref:Uncharacterized protein n=1 Tax=Melastoma candidum TaxID=119954 RepID=A0ACB9NUE9_9MYRT|nr:hypothetical protein MLD38_024025 [Melastoma candidum]